MAIFEQYYLSSKAKHNINFKGAVIMKFSRKLVTVVTAICLLFSIFTISASAASTPSVSIDGKALSISSSYGSPFIDSSSRLLVPLRIISEKLGATVTYQQSSKTAIINGNIKIAAGSNTITTPTGTIAMDTKAVIKNGRMYIPLSYVGNALGYKIESTAKNGTINANIVTKVKLTISAAASLKDVMNEINTTYAKVKPNTTLTFNFAASGTLQQQIEQGADADVFLSAATKNMDTLKNAGLLVDSTVKSLLGNEVVLVVPNDSKVAINSFDDVTSSKIDTVALGEPKTVPAGQYAEDVFTYMKVLDKVKAKAVYAKDVREVLTWVETGNADAGVVYSTDAKTSTKVKVVATAPSGSHKAIVYPAAVIKSSSNINAASDFVNFLSSDAAKAVFTKYGFTVK
jgi:molybdate transport system substrate-binding protein